MQTKEVLDDPNEHTQVRSCSTRPENQLKYTRLDTFIKHGAALNGSFEQCMGLWVPGSISNCSHLQKSWLAAKEDPTQTWTSLTPKT
jgi:hypothetical protein